jgi:alpha-mannosidase
METYPDYVFGASQPQLYLWMKERYPSLYEKIKRRVAEERWEVQGGMWVEADTNLSGAESLVRQFLYGKRFFREEFGKDMRILWLPDVFGYAGSLPQIMRQSGVDFFMTTKLSWNVVNMFPHHSFIWKGIDGSTVIAHMPPEGTYNSSGLPRAVAKSEKVFLEKDVSDRCLLVFGIGDGGGGPGEEHLERLSREKNLEGLAPVRQEHALSFFESIAKDAGKLKTWQGELYLERHQGTYTTQARS